MKTYTAGVDLFLIDGEICIFCENRRNMLYTTGKNYPERVKQLDRSLFVKPVNVGELASDFAKRNEFKPYSSDAYSGFKAGYKANKNKFTWEEMETAIAYASISTIAGHDLDDIKRIFFENHRKLSLPKSFTIDGDKIEVNW